MNYETNSIHMGATKRSIPTIKTPTSNPMLVSNSNNFIRPTLSNAITKTPKLTLEINFETSSIHIGAIKRSTPTSKTPTRNLC